MAAFDPHPDTYLPRNPWETGTVWYTNVTPQTLSLDCWATGSNYPPPRPSPQEPQESPRAAELRRHRAASRRAVLEALAARRGLRDDPSPLVPLPARKGFSGRPAARKRVCAGSSRYRVLVN